MNVKKIILISIITICGLSHAEGRQRRPYNDHNAKNPPVNSDIFGKNRVQLPNAPKHVNVRGYVKNNGRMVNNYSRSRPGR
ncbi:MAG: hypothetical protein ACTHJ2_09630 [Candidatus Nitrosocosmicus sp.]